MTKVYEIWFNPVPVPILGRSLTTINFPCCDITDQKLEGSVLKVPKNNTSNPRTKTTTLFHRDGLRVEAKLSSIQAHRGPKGKRPSPRMGSET
jgi:hypothetical protein